MSNIYIQEPPTSGKVLLVTSCGEIDIELWSKEAPKACRNFVQLCLEGYYDGTIFHRVVKDFIVQGGDPTGSGHGGESVYGKPFRDEFHSRLRFVRRGLVAMANAGPHDNGSQFFFTLGTTPELNNKHTVFGKVAGNTVYNMLRLADCETDGEDRPLYPPKIKKTKVLSNPFDDIVPRSLPKGNKEEDEGKKKKSKSKATKNFSLLSFGEEAEEDEQEVIQASKDLKGKSKSSHDLLQDEKLSSVPALETLEADKKRKKEDIGGEENTDSSEDEERKEQRKENVRKKLKKESPAEVPVPVPEPEKKTENEPKKNDRTEELKREIRELKKEILKVTKKQAAASEEKHGDVKEAVTETVDTSDTKEDPVNAESTDSITTFMEDVKKYEQKRKKQKKGSDRESQTLALLAKFQNKLTSVRKLASDYADEEEESTEKQEMIEPEEDDEDDVNDISWMSHKLQFEDQKRKVLDANISDIDRYEIFDPRNPMNQRRREASKNAMKDKR